MVIGVILCLCILATAKVTVQGKFAKGNIHTFRDAIFFNTFVFLFATILFFKDIWTLSFPVFLFAMIFGLLTVLFQMSYIKAMSQGNVSLTVLIVNLSMVIPVLVSVFYYQERLSVLRFSGIFLTVFALILSVDNKSAKKASGKWFYLSLAASLCNGAMSVCQKIFSKTQWQSETRPFVACSYAVATGISLLFYWLLKQKNATESKISSKFFLYALAVGLILGVFQVLNTRAIAMIDGTLFFPAYYGGALVLSYISSFLILKETITSKQKLSFSIGILATILMNL